MSISSASPPSTTGPIHEREPGRWGAAAAVLLLATLWAALALPGIFSTPFDSKGEPREALAVREMVRDGHWILPLRNGTEIPSKPLLFHWCAAAAALVRGRLDEGTMRLPSALAALAAVLITFALARPRLGNAGAAVAGAVLATSFEWLRAAREARVDMMHAACLTGALAALDVIFRRGAQAPARSRAWWGILGVSSGLAVLAKGPVGLLLPMAAAVVLAALRLRTTPIGWRGPALALATALIVSGWWYAAASIAGGRPFVEKQLLAENLQRFAGTKSGHGSHVKPPHYYAGALAAGFLPWTLLLPLAGAGWWQARRRGDRPDLLVPAVWFIVVVGFYSLSAGKRSVYILAAYPAAAILFAAGWESWVRQRTVAPQPPASVRAGRGAQVLRVASALPGLALLAISTAEVSGLNVLEWVAPVLHERDRRNLLLAGAGLREHPVAALLGVAAAGLALWLAVEAARRRRPRASLAAIVAAVVAGTWLAGAVLLPEIAQARSFRSFFAAEVLPRVKTDERLLFLRTFAYGAVWYAGRDIPVRETLPPKESPPAWVLVADRVWETLDPAERSRLERVAVSEATDPTGRWHLVLARLRPPEAVGESVPHRHTGAGSAGPDLSRGYVRGAADFGAFSSTSSLAYFRCT